MNKRLLLLMFLSILPLSIFSQVPAPPTNVHAAWINDSSVVLNWDEVAGAAGYLVYRYENNAWTLAGDSIDPIFFESPGQHPPLDYAISAVNAAGQGPAAGVAVAADGCAGFTLTIYQPDVNYLSLTATNATLTVVANVSSGMRALVELGTSPTNLFLYDVHPNFETPHTFHFTNLVPATQYFYTFIGIGTNDLGSSYTNSFWTQMSNRPPVVQDLTVSMPPCCAPGFEDFPFAVSVPLTATDSDYPPQSITFRVTSLPSMGTLSDVTVSWDGSVYVNYTPNPGTRGTDSFQFAASDGELESGPATVTITNIFLNRAPIVASPLFLTTQEDVPLSFILPVTDPDGDPLTFELAGAPFYPEIARTISGTAPAVTFTPDPNFNGVIPISWWVTDPYGAGRVMDVLVMVTPVNDPGTIQNQAITIPEDTTYNGYVVISDPESNPHTLLLYSAPTNGVVQISGTNFTYTVSQPNFVGADTIRFTAVDDQNVATGVGWIYITVANVNDAPVASAVSVSGTEDTSVAIALAGSDVDGDALTFRVVTGPQNGILTGSGGNRTYIPNQNFAGNDSFTYVANDGQIDSAAATVTIVINPVDDAPIAQAQSVNLPEDSSVEITLTAADVDGGPRVFSLITSPTHGSLTGTIPNLTYVPAANYPGSDSFVFGVSDGAGSSSQASVTISVTPVNDAPVASAVSVSGTEDTSITIALAGSDVDGDALTFRVVTGPQNGILTGSGSNRTYIPNSNFSGNDSFTYVVNDGQIDSAPATATIMIDPIDDGPIAQAQSVTLQEDSNVAITLTASDVDGGPRVFSVISPPAHGTLTGTIPDLTYNPAPNYFGPDSFVFAVSNGAASSSEASVTINVTPLNDAPAASPQSVTTPYNTACSITLSGNDVEGNSLSCNVLTSPAGGTLSGSAPNLIFTPQIGWSGSTSFTFKVNDGALDSTPATVSITVNAPGSVPAAPSNLTATAISKTQIDIAWTDNSNEDGFKIERSTNGSTWTQIATVGANIVRYSSTGLSANKLYYYRVRAYNVLGNSSYSNTATAKTLK